VEKAVRDLKVTYPVAIDSEYAFGRPSQRILPAHYFIDGKGASVITISGGEYDESERVIQELLKENGAKSLADGVINVSANGALAAPDSGNTRSPETYIVITAPSISPRSSHQQGFEKVYTLPAAAFFESVGLAGSWKVSPESAVLQTASGKLHSLSRARLASGARPQKDGKPIRFRVKLDELRRRGPWQRHRHDRRGDGWRTPAVSAHPQRARWKTGLLRLSFSIPGVQAFAFTFGEARLSS